MNFKLTISTFVFIGILGTSTLALPRSTESAKKTDSQSERSRRVDRTQGSRGCRGGLASANIETLAEPVTFRTHPTIVFFVETPPNYPLRVVVAKSGGTGPLFEKIWRPDGAGLVVLDYPSESPALEKGEAYWLTIMELCDEQRLSRNSYVRVPLKRLALPEGTGSESELNSMDDMAKVRYLASLGFVADAIKESIDCGDCRLVQEMLQLVGWPRLVMELDFGNRMGDGIPPQQRETVSSWLKSCSDLAQKPTP